MVDIHATVGTVKLEIDEDMDSQQNGIPPWPMPPSFDGMVLPPFPPLRKDAKGRFEAIRDLETRTDDVILAIFPKSGTHWVWEIVNMLLSGAADYTKAIKESQFMEAIPDLSIVDNLTSPRNLNTHLPYRWLPKQHLQSGGKIVHVLRNPKDVVVSMYHHLKSSGEIANLQNVTFEEFARKQFFSPRTHWVWEIVNMLLSGAADYTKATKESQFIEAIPDLSIVDNLTSPRNLNTHLPYRWLPKQHLQSGGKIVHVLRNPKDVVVSMYHHLKSSGQIANVKDLTFEDFAKKQFFSPHKVMGGWFKYEKEFEKAEENDKTCAICTLHYESLKKDPVKEITRLAEFLEVTYSEELIREIADKCSFQRLKEAHDTIKSHDGMKNASEESADEVKTKPDYENLRKNLYRKGQIGDWKNHFTDALNEQFDALFTEEMKTSKLQIQFE